MCMDRHTGGQTGIQAARQAGMNKLTVAFHSFANMHKKRLRVSRGNSLEALYR